VPWRLRKFPEMQGAQAKYLPDGKRLHLHHGPIDLIVEASGPDREAAHLRAVARIETVLQELVDELPELRQATTPGRSFRGSVARRMQTAVEPHTAVFSTPMAAVAGAVADEILQNMTQGLDLTKTYVNNGGDTAFFLGPGQHLEAAIAGPMAGRVALRAEDPYRGIATSGWGGRSHSLGIADTVSVVGATAAAADIAATLIANAVDLPGHAAIERTPAEDLFPDSDLGERLVTTAVGPLSTEEIETALGRGADFAQGLLDGNLIAGAVLFLSDHVHTVGARQLLPEPTGDLIHA